MDLLTVCGIGIGLSMDAFAVSISCGLTIKNLTKRNAFKIGAFFGGFQAVMPVIGWLAGLKLRTLIGSLDHWIAFGLLGIIGVRMIHEAWKQEQEECRERSNPLATKRLLILSIATSIDALAVGLSFALLDISIVIPVILIGLITFTISFFGVLGGRKLGCYFRKKVEIAGGLILIGIGLKILIQHIIDKI